MSGLRYLGVSIGLVGGDVTVLPADSRCTC